MSRKQRIENGQSEVRMRENLDCDCASTMPQPGQEQASALRSIPSVWGGAWRCEGEAMSRMLRGLPSMTFRRSAGRDVMSTRDLVIALPTGGRRRALDPDRRSERPVARSLAPVTTGEAW